MVFSPVLELWTLLCCCRSQSVVEPGVLKRPDKVKSDEDNMQPLLSLDWDVYYQLESVHKSVFSTHTNTWTYMGTSQTQQKIKHIPYGNLLNSRKRQRREEHVLSLKELPTELYTVYLFIYLATCQVPILGSVIERLEIINWEQRGLLKSFFD